VRLPEPSFHRYALIKRWVVAAADIGTRSSGVFATSGAENIIGFIGYAAVTCNFARSFRGATI
jgi:hypothetical protein